MKTAYAVFLVLAVLSGVFLTQHNFLRPQLNETERDEPWASLSRKMIADAVRGAPVLADIKARVPELITKLSEDAKREEWLRLWGYSVNYDEIAKGVIVHPAILKALAEAIRHPDFASEGSTKEGYLLVHAGLEHTYGYLFSVLKTPFGYKRARWVDGNIETGLDLEPGTFSGIPKEGTLLSNLTYFSGKVAFRGEKELNRILEDGKKGISKSVRDLDYSKLDVTRIEETVKIQNHTVSLFTDLVLFKKIAGSNSHLLIYSVKDTRAGGVWLITAFPVGADFVTKITSPEQMGEGKEITTQYNGYVSGMTGEKLVGVRLKK